MPLELNWRIWWERESFWRFVDTLGPRGFGFVLHSWLIWHFGAENYALPVWVIGTFSMVATFIPDPSAYVLLARNDAQARRRAKLLSAWLWAKILISVAISIVAPFVFAQILLIGASGVAVLGGVIFAATDTLWSVVGTNCFAEGRIKGWAQIGFVLRTLVLCGLLFLSLIAELDIGVALLVYSLPLLAACIYALPRPYFHSRSVIAGSFALKNYSLWTQINSFSLQFLSQIPIVLAGATPSVTPDNVGKLAYIWRILNQFVQPLSVLQSIIVREFARTGDILSAIHLRKYIRLTSLFIAIMSCIIAWLTPELTNTLLLLGGGLAFFTALRFEFALLNALRSVRFMASGIFMPALLPLLPLLWIFRYDLVIVAGLIAASYVALAGLVFKQVHIRIYSKNILR